MSPRGTAPTSRGDRESGRANRSFRVYVSYHSSIQEVVVARLGATTNLEVNGSLKGWATTIRETDSCLDLLLGTGKCWSYGLLEAMVGTSVAT